MTTARARRRELLRLLAADPDARALARAALFATAAVIAAAAVVVATTGGCP